MRIALVAPLAEAVPPKLYGGTERVVSWLAEELVRQGHRVALFASAESETAAELIVCAPQSLRLAGYRDHLGNTLAMLREVRRRADDFDIIHFHVDLLPQALFHDIAHKCLVTLHGRLDLPDAWPLYKPDPAWFFVAGSFIGGTRREDPANAHQGQSCQRCRSWGRNRSSPCPANKFAPRHGSTRGLSHSPAPSDRRAGRQGTRTDNPGGELIRVNGACCHAEISDPLADLLDDSTRLGEHPAFPQSAP